LVDVDSLKPHPVYRSEPHCAGVNNSDGITWTETTGRVNTYRRPPSSSHWAAVRQERLSILYHLERQPIEGNAR